MRAFLLLAAAPLFAQPQALPAVVAVAGGSYNRYAQPRQAAGFVSLLKQLGDSRGYSFTTVEFTPAAYTIRTGVAYVTVQAGPFALLSLVDGGTAVANSSATVAFSGGGAASLRLGLSGWHVFAAVRMASVGTQVKPIGEIGLARSF